MIWLAPAFLIIFAISLAVMGERRLDFWSPFIIIIIIFQIQQIIKLTTKLDIDTFYLGVREVGGDHGDGLG